MRIEIVDPVTPEDLEALGNRVRQDSYDYAVEVHPDDIDYAAQAAQAALEAKRQKERLAQRKRLQADIRKSLEKLNR